MKSLNLLLIFMAAGTASLAADYPLQAPAGINILYISGFSVSALTKVTGEIDYKYQGACSGRGCRPPKPRFYQGKANWDLYGRLLSVTYTETAGIPVPQHPNPISIVGPTITYGMDAEGDTTGQTSSKVGFVHHLSSDYMWSPAPVLYTTNQNPISFQASLISTGDVDLVVYSTTAQSRFAARVTVTSDGCAGKILAAGARCTIAGTYDPTSFVESEAPVIYDSLLIDLTTNTGISHEYTETVAVKVD
jgi:hypothetical protein